MAKRLQKSSVKKRVPVRSVSKIKTYQSSEKPDQVGAYIDFYGDTVHKF